MVPNRVHPRAPDQTATPNHPHPHLHHVRPGQPDQTRVVFAHQSAKPNQPSTALVPSQVSESATVHGAAIGPLELETKTQDAERWGTASLPEECSKAGHVVIKVSVVEGPYNITGPTRVCVLGLILHQHCIVSSRLLTEKLLTAITCFCSH